MSSIKHVLTSILLFYFLCLQRTTTMRRTVKVRFSLLARLSSNHGGWYLIYDGWSPYSTTRLCGCCPLTTSSSTISHSVSFAYLLFAGQAFSQVFRLHLVSFDSLINIPKFNIRILPVVLIPSSIISPLVHFVFFRYGPDRPKFLGSFSEGVTPSYLNGKHIFRS